MSKKHSFFGVMAHDGFLNYHSSVYKYEQHGFRGQIGSLGGFHIPMIDGIDCKSLTSGSPRTGIRFLWFTAMLTMWQLT